MADRVDVELGSIKPAVSTQQSEAVSGNRSLIDSRKSVSKPGTMSRQSSADDAKDARPKSSEKKKPSFIDRSDKKKQTRDKIKDDYSTFVRERKKAKRAIYLKVTSCGWTILIVGLFLAIIGILGNVFIELKGVNETNETIALAIRVVGSNSLFIFIGLMIISTVPTTEVNFENVKEKVKKVLHFLAFVIFIFIGLNYLVQPPYVGGIVIVIYALSYLVHTFFGRNYPIREGYTVDFYFEDELQKRCKIGENKDIVNGKFKFEGWLSGVVVKECEDKKDGEDNYSIKYNYCPGHVDVTEREKIAEAVPRSKIRHELVGSVVAVYVIKCYLVFIGSYTFYIITLCGMSKYEFDKASFTRLHLYLLGSKSMDMFTLVNFSTRIVMLFVLTFTNLRTYLIGTIRKLILEIIIENAIKEDDDVNNELKPDNYDVDHNKRQSSYKNGISDISDVKVKFQQHQDSFTEAGKFSILTQSKWQKELVKLIEAKKKIKDLSYTGKSPAQEIAFKEAEEVIANASKEFKKRIALREYDEIEKYRRGRTIEDLFKKDKSIFTDVIYSFMRTLILYFGIIFLMIGVQICEGFWYFRSSTQCRVYALNGGVYILFYLILHFYSNEVFTFLARRFELNVERSIKDGYFLGKLIAFSMGDIYDEKNGEHYDEYWIFRHKSSKMESVFCTLETLRGGNNDSANNNFIDRRFWIKSIVTKLPSKDASGKISLPRHCLQIDIKDDLDIKWRRKYVSKKTKKANLPNGGDLPLLIDLKGFELINEVVEEKTPRENEVVSHPNSYSNLQLSKGKEEKVGFHGRSTNNSQSGEKQEKKVIFYPVSSRNLADKEQLDLFLAESAHILLYDHYTGSSSDEYQRWVDDNILQKVGEKIEAKCSIIEFYRDIRPKLIIEDQDNTSDKKFWNFCINNIRQYQFDENFTMKLLTESPRVLTDKDKDKLYSLSKPLKLVEEANPQQDPIVKALTPTEDKNNQTGLKNAAFPTSTVLVEAGNPQQGQTVNAMHSVEDKNNQSNQKNSVRLTSTDNTTRITPQGSSSPFSFLTRFFGPKLDNKIDFFISHSWLDDAPAKFHALTAFSEKFKEQNGRFPTYWFDKCCINQRDTTMGVAALPVNVGACNKFLIILGKTYLKRLWCLLELFTIMFFCNKELALERIVILPLDGWCALKDMDDFANPHNGHGLDDAHCFDPNEEFKIRLIIDLIGKDRFTACICDIMDILKQKMKQSIDFD